jgi:hypothetical protein
MSGIDFGLGRFGDRRLEKGGRFCIGRWLIGPAPVFGGLGAIVPRRCSSGAFCITDP